jgi:hypothetical protein
MSNRFRWEPTPGEAEAAEWRAAAEHAESEASRLAATSDARWQALKDYLDKRITELKDEAIEELPPPGSLARVFQEKAATLASVRKRMDELEES